MLFFVISVVLSSPADSAQFTVRGIAWRRHNNSNCVFCSSLCCARWLH